MNFQKELNTALKWFSTALIVLWLLTILYFWRNQMSPFHTIQLLPDMTLQATKSWQFWAFILLPYTIFIWLRYLVVAFKNRGTTIFFKRLVLTISLPLLTFFSIVKIAEIANQESDWKGELAARNFQIFNHFAKDGKMRGVHFVPSRNPETDHFLPLVKNNIEWIALSNFAWQQTPTTDSIRRPPLNEFGWSKKDSSILETVNFAKKNGIRTFLQPKILVENSKKTATQNIQFDQDIRWKNWSHQYQNFILQQAKIAQQAKIEAFCIGTQLSQLTATHPDFFNDLIDSVRAVYQGKLTYAADWQEEFLTISFWQKLDYIGIQANFSLTDVKKPSVTELKTAWQPYFEKIKTLQQQVNRPIIFTEIGYNSTEEAAFEPHKKEGGLSGLFQEISTQTQANCYLAFFEIFWQEPWFAGAFFFDWRANYDLAGGENSAGFSPQNKEAEAILEDWFSKKPLPPYSSE